MRPERGRGCRCIRDRVAPFRARLAGSAVGPSPPTAWRSPGRARPRPRLPSSLVSPAAANEIEATLRDGLGARDVRVDPIDLNLVRRLVQRDQGESPSLTSAPSSNSRFAMKPSHARPEIHLVHRLDAARKARGRRDLRAGDLGHGHGRWRRRGSRLLLRFIAPEEEYPVATSAIACACRHLAVSSRLIGMTIPASVAGILPALKNPTEVLRSSVALSWLLGHCALLGGA